MVADFETPAGGERQSFGGLQIRIVALQCRYEELVGLRHEEFWVLVERSVICIRIKGQLRVGQVLLQDVRVHRGHDDIVAALHDQCRLTDIFQIVENSLGRRGISADGIALRRRRCFAHLGIAILAAKLAIQKGKASGPARRGRREMNRKPEMLWRIYLLFNRTALPD